MPQHKDMPWEWAIGRYTGERAKYIKGLVDAGIGYFMRSETGKMNYAIEAAFRLPLDRPIPEHLQRADDVQAKKLDALYNQRHAVRDEAQNQALAGELGSEIGSIIRSQGLRAYYAKMKKEKHTQFHVTFTPNE